MAQLKLTWARRLSMPRSRQVFRTSFTAGSRLLPRLPVAQSPTLLLTVSYAEPCSDGVKKKGQMTTNTTCLDKAAVTEYAKTRGFKSAVAVSPGWYLENHLSEELAPAIGGFPFVVDEEGQLTLRVPRWGGDDKIPFIGIGDDYGDIVHGVLLSPEEYNGKLVQGVSVSATAHELTAEFGKGKLP